MRCHHHYHHYYDSYYYYDYDYYYYNDSSYIRSDVGIGIVGEQLPSNRVVAVVHSVHQRRLSQLPRQKRFQKHHCHTTSTTPLSYRIQLVDVSAVLDECLDTEQTATTTG